MHTLGPLHFVAIDTSRIKIDPLSLAKGNARVFLFINYAPLVLWYEPVEQYEGLV